MSNRRASLRVVEVPAPVEQAPHDDDWLTREEVAGITRFSAQTLANWAYHKKGPRFVRVHGKVRYRRGDVTQWQRSHYEE